MSRLVAASITTITAIAIVLLLPVFYYNMVYTETGLLSTWPTYIWPAWSPYAWSSWFGWPTWFGWYASGLLQIALAMGLVVAAGVYTAVVVWNPDMKYLVAGVTGPTGVVRACGCGVHAKTGRNKINSDQPKPHLDHEGLDNREGLEQSPEKISSGVFYAEYHSHRLEHLARVRAVLASQGCRRFVYFCGDSTLDNKHWLFRPYDVKEAQMCDLEFTAAALNGYEHALLAPARMVQDVSYWMNRGASERLGTGKLCTLMTSIEESTLEDRSRAGLLKQDRFVRDHITETDFLVVSLGGNDVALNPTLRTVVNMFLLTRSPDWMIRLGVAPGYGYFLRLFRDRTLALIKQVVAKRKPHKILLCMLYYLDETPSNGGSWADPTLRALGYDSNPKKLQLIISTLFQEIERSISNGQFVVPGVPHVKPFALFRVLDGSDSGDYAQRVEPSVQGGRKMAAAFLDELIG